MDDEFGIDLDRVRVFLRDKERRRRAAVDARFERAGRDARAIVAQIAAEVNPQRIYQWGSLLDRTRFSEISDIDIAVEGLRGPAEFFRTLGIAMEGTSLRWTSSRSSGSRRIPPSASGPGACWSMSGRSRELSALVSAYQKRLEAVRRSIEQALADEIAELGKTPRSALIIRRIAQAKKKGADLG